MVFSMVDSIKPTYGTVPPKSKLQKEVEALSSTQADKDERMPFIPPQRPLERRKRGDRRSKLACRGLYDMRQSKGRRKTDYPHSPIETEV